MGRMIDAVNPANIGPEYNGRLAVRVTVLADPAGQVFDVEAGNIGPDPVAAAMHTRIVSGRWAVGYVNEQTYQTLTTALAAHGHHWSPAADWPAPGCYLWCADPSGNIAAGRWPVPVHPLAVQDTYAGVYDLSTTADNFPAEVAGYIDGPQSVWPPDAWARFATLPDTPTGPPRPPVPIPEVEPMEVTTDHSGNPRIVGRAVDNGNLVVLTEVSPGQWSVVDVTDQLKGKDPTRVYQVQ